MAKTIGQLTQATTIGGADELVIEQSGLTKRVAASVVRGGLVNADIDAAAAIAFSKLAALDSANILVGNGSNVATKVAVTGDVTISNAGVTAIGSAKVTPTMLTQPLTLATAQNTTSGTSIDFTGIPSWVKRITVMLSGVSTNGSSSFQLQIGDAGGIETTSYVAGSSFISITANTTDAALWTTGFGVTLGGNASTEISGIGLITNLSGNTWVYQFIGTYASGATAIAGGTKTLSATLDRIRLTTDNGTDDFDAGSVNIMYEG
jgi:hypothetical protein